LIITALIFVIVDSNVEILNLWW